MNKIKLIIILFMFCFYNDSDASVSFSKALQIYNKLCRAATVCPPFAEYNSNEVNAEYNPYYGVFVYKGMLKFVDNEEQLALVLGHELGHVVHKDSGKSIQEEYAADYYGALLIKRCGYNVHKAAYILIKFKKTFGDSGGDDHPRNSDRYKRIEGL